MATIFSGCQLQKEKFELLKKDSIIANCFDNETGRFLVSNTNGYYIEGDIKKVHLFPRNNNIEYLND